MTTLKQIVGLGLLLVCACASASATDYTFVATSGDWNDPENWYPDDHKPSLGDTATIPSGHTCIVGEADQSADAVTVASGATLRIDNRRLSIDADGGTGLTVNGTVEFKNTATLTTLSSLTVAGSGSLTTLSGAEGWVGTVLEDSSVWITIQSGLTFKGTFKFRANIHNDGILAVDSASHDMEIGEADGSGWTVVVNGSGKFRATAGQLRFGHSAPSCTAEAAQLVVNGGTLRFYDMEGLWIVPWTVQVSAGTLWFDDSFTCTGTLDFSGGVIKVAQDKAAAFGDDGI